MLTKLSQDVWIDIDQILVFDNKCDCPMVRFKSDPENEFCLTKEDANELQRIMIEESICY